MRQEGHLAEIKEISGHGYDHNQLSTDKGIVAKDILDIESSTLVVFNFLGAKKVSVGSVWEMGYAKKCGKPIIMIIEPHQDVRTAVPGNPHDHCFITESAQFRVTTIDEAAAIVNALLTPGI